MAKKNKPGTSHDRGYDGFRAHPGDEDDNDYSPRPARDHHGSSRDHGHRDDHWDDQWDGHWGWNEMLFGNRTAFNPPAAPADRCHPGPGGYTHPHLPADTGPMTFTLGGDAIATGDNTNTAGAIYCRVEDGEELTIARGSATFSATALSFGGNMAYAGASSFFAVDGADFLFTYTTHSSIHASKCGVSYWSEQSTTQFLAIDIKDFDLPGGPITLAYDSETWPRSLTLPLNGNLATFNADAVLHADHADLALDFSLLTIEDQLSTLSAVLTAQVA